jgi:DNA-binding XRE family transcriptional regulator
MVVAATNKILKGLRQRWGLAQVGLAVLAKVSPNTVLSIERWGHVPSEPVQRKIAEALQVQVSDIWPESGHGDAA